MIIVAWRQKAELHIKARDREKKEKKERFSDKLKLRLRKIVISSDDNSDPICWK
jgi:hypothetical protein